MRLSIILAICFIGVTVSASSLRTQRGVFVDPKNETKNAHEGDDFIRDFFTILEQIKDTNPVAAKILDMMRHFEDDDDLKILKEIHGKHADNPLDLNIYNVPSKFNPGDERANDFMRDFFITLEQIRDKNPAAAKIVDIMRHFEDFDDYETIKETLNKHNKSETVEVKVSPSGERANDFIRDFFTILEQIKDTNPAAARILDMMRDFEDDDDLKILKDIRSKHADNPLDLNIFNVPSRFNPGDERANDFMRDFFITLGQIKDKNRAAAKILDIMRHFEDLGDFKMINETRSKH